MPNPNLPNNPGYNLYVGARYVPIFSDVNNGVWTDNLAYEPLTIVTYLGDSYTSKTYVPAGISPTNETYWAKTGNYNAQIETLNQKINSVKQSLTSLDGEVAQIDVELENLSNSTTQSVTNLTRDISTRQPILSKANYICFGDSTNVQMNGGWGSQFISIIGGNGVRVGNSAAGFTRPGSDEPYQNKNFQETLAAYVSTLTDIQKQNVSYFIMVGGCNDYIWGDTLNTNQASVTNFFNYVKSSFPNAEIYWGMNPISPINQNKANVLKNRATLISYVENVGYVKILRYLTKWGYGHLSYYKTNDAVHISSAENYRKMASFIANQINGPGGPEMLPFSITCDIAHDGWAELNTSYMSDGVIHIGYCLNNANTPKPTNTIEYPQSAGTRRFTFTGLDSFTGTNTGTRWFPVMYTDKISSTAICESFLASIDGLTLNSAFTMGEAGHTSFLIMNHTTAME